MNNKDQIVLRKIQGHIESILRYCEGRWRPFHATGRRCSCSGNGVNPSFCSTMASSLKYRSRIISEYLLLGERPFSFAGKTKKAQV